MSLVVGLSVLFVAWMSVLIFNYGLESISRPGDHIVVYSIDAMPFVRDVAPAWTFTVAGIFAWRRRPDSRIGPLMVLIGASLVVWALRGTSIPPLVTLGVWMSEGRGASGVLLGLLVLAYPTGRIVSRLDRAWVMLGLGWLLIVQLLLALATPIGFWGCVECRPLLVGWYHEGTRMAFLNLSTLIFTALAVALVLLLIRRWLRASVPARRVLAPIWLAGAVVPAVAVMAAIVEGTG